jgi:hypothetical protein
MVSFHSAISVVLLPPVTSYVLVLCLMGDVKERFNHGRAQYSIVVSQCWCFAVAAPVIGCWTERNLDYFPREKECGSQSETLLSTLRSISPANQRPDSATSFSLDDVTNPGNPINPDNPASSTQPVLCITLRILYGICIRHTSYAHTYLYAMDVPSTCSQ